MITLVDPQLFQPTPSPAPPVNSDSFNPRPSSSSTVFSTCHAGVSSSTSSSSALPSTKSPDDLLIFYQNVRGLRTKLKQLRTGIHLDGYNIFAFSESNLTSSHFTSELGFDHFTVYRCDRNSNSSKKKSGGGVLLAISNSILSNQIVGSIKQIELLFVRISWQVESCY